MTSAHTPLHSCSLTHRSALTEHGCVFVCWTLYCVKAASVPISPLDGETERLWEKRLAVYQNAPLECCAQTEAKHMFCITILLLYIEIPNPGSRTQDLFSLRGGAILFLPFCVCVCVCVCFHTMWKTGLLWGSYNV